jgi:hypothetical protein
VTIPEIISHYSGMGYSIGVLRNPVVSWPEGQPDLDPTAVRTQA